MITLAQARARIFTIVGGVAGIAGQAKVHDYLRWGLRDADLRALCVGPSNRLHVWMVSLYDADPHITLSASGAPGHTGLNYEQSRYQFAIHGWYAHNDADASEKAWTDQVAAVIAAFRADKKLTLGDPVANPPVIDSGPAQWAEAPFRKFTGVLCHYGRLSLPVKVQTDP
jgi:hypothetical protein